MKRILALTFCLGLALTQMAHADDKDKEKKHAKRHADKEAAVEQRSAIKAQKQNAKVDRRAQVQRNVQTQPTVNTQRFNRKYQNTIVSNQNNRVITENNRVIRRNNVIVRNRNSWYDARRFNWRQRHDRDWWRHHYGSTRFVLFGGGYYFWNNGYWYPAYGYDPVYSTYIYDEPIYGYNQYEPGRVISNVQIELQRRGYYRGPVDGLIGPMTRSALARYQADHGLYVTRAIDEPTLETLGLV